MTAPQVLGVPSEGKENFLKGCALGPAWIRWGFQSIEDWSPWQEAPVPPFVDRGDLPMDVESDSGAARVGKIREALTSMGDEPLLLLGGDHLVTYPAVRRALKFHPDLVVVHLDAHLDARDRYLGERWSHATVMRRLREHLPAERLFSIGIRSRAVEEEVDWTVLTGASAEVQLRALEGPVYLTLDVDVLDPAFFPAVSNAEPGGVSVDTVISWISALRGKLVGADLVEVNPVAAGGSVAFAAVAGVLLRELLVAFS